jgi:hypothetical protein
MEDYGMNETINSGHVRGTLPSFDAARPLGLGDERFVAELYELLARHDNIDRFGLCLLHDHFPVASGEILLETNDPAQRTLSLEVAQIDALRDENIKVTSWRFAGAGTVPLTGCAEDKCKIESASALGLAVP